MNDDMNQRYRITEVPLEGTIAEVEELIPYKSGTGFFRNVVLAVPGVLDTEAYAPVTLFGTDASGLDPELDIGRQLRCTGRLTSRRYLDRNGRPRWAVSLTATGVMLGPRKAMAPAAAGGGGTGGTGGTAEAMPSAVPMEPDDDIPF